MTTYVDIHAIRRIIDRVGLEDFMRGLEKQMHCDFVRWQDFDKCPRVASHTKDGVVELMPVADQHQHAFKYVNGHPANTKSGIPTVMAFGALANMDTGYPVLLAELTLTTAFRTAVASAMAAKALARADSNVMAMIGCGAQSEFQAIAFHTLLGINEIRIFDIDPNAMQKLQGHLKLFPELEVVMATSTEQAVKGADIVTTCTADKNWATILTDNMIEPGTHINAIGGDCPGKTELDVALLRRGKIFVEFEPQTRIEGDIQQLAPDHPVTEIWRVLSGEVQGRESHQQITIFDSVGFALEDYSALRYVWLLSKLLDEGETIELIPKQENPKDLFGFYRQSNNQKPASTESETWTETASQNELPVKIPEKEKALG